MFGTLDPNDKNSVEKYRRDVLPMLDQNIRQTISMLWLALPAERKSVSEVEREFRRLANRALANLREDATSFGITDVGR